MNKVLQSLIVATTATLALQGGTHAQSNSPTIVQVPGATDEQIENAVAPTGGNVASQTPLPTPGIPESSRLSQSVIEAWLVEPSSLLVSYPTAGQPMIQYVVLLAGSDARTIEPLIGLAGRPAASARHVRAIAYGLGGAAKAAQSTAPDYSAYILLKVASSGNQQLIDYFGLALRGEGDIETAELPGGVVGGGLGPTSGSGSVTGGGGIGGSGNGSGSSTVGISAGSFSIGGGSVGGVGDDGNDVSPIVIR